MPGSSHARDLAATTSFSWDEHREAWQACRKRAEATIATKADQLPADLRAVSPEETQRMLYELRVYQIELEAQNEELRRTQLELVASRERYFELYDLAPVGYCTLNRQGLLVQANLRAGSLLGVTREALLKQPITRFVAPPDQDDCYLLLKRLIKTGEPQSRDFQMVKQEGMPFWANLTATRAPDEDGASLLRVVLTDVSERKRSEAALRQSQTFNQSVLDSLSEHVAVLDPSGVILAVNQAWRRFGQNNAAPAHTVSPIGVNYLGVCGNVVQDPDGDAGASYAGIQGVLSGELNQFQLEYPCHGPDEMRWYRMSVTPLKGSLHGALVSHQDISVTVSTLADTRRSVVIIHHDITARKHAEMKLAKREEIFASLVAQAGSGIVLIDLQTRKFTEFNEAAHLILGYSREEFVNFGVPEIQGEMDEATIAARYAAIIEHGYGSFDTLHRHKDGTLLPVHVSLRTLTIDGTQYMVGILTDITQRKAQEVELRGHREHLQQLVQDKTVHLNEALAALQISERKHRLLIENSHDIIYTLDRRGLVTFASPSWTALLGHPVGQVIDQPLASFVHPDDLGACLAEAKTLYVSRQRVFQIGYRIRHLNGTWRWHNCNAIALTDESGSVCGIEGCASDITERKLAEDAAHAANRAKSEFLANMSHEIRTPMNGVVGMVDVLQQTELKPEQQRMLDTIHQSSCALLHILNDILDFSKIEAGKLSVESLPTSLREVAEGAAQLVGSSIGAQLVDLSVFVSPDLPRWVLCDPTRLRQVLLNLMGNAVKFVSKREGTPPRVTLFVQLCTLADERAGVQLRVTDDGIGMSPEVVAKLFQPFMQAQTSTSRQFGGTGLGLSISQRLVKLLGGQISVRSTLGAGSEFTVELPLLATEATAMPVFEPRLDGVCVLVITRDAAALQIIPAYCQAAGAKVITVPDLASARQQLVQAPALGGPTVVLVGLFTAAPTAQLELPAGVSVVRLVRRAGPTFANDITLNARPLLQLDLIHAVAVAAGRLIRPNTEDQTDQGIVTAPPQAPSIEEAAATRRLILVAEDNETNREVMQEQLRLLGYAAEVAEDGAIALQMWRSGRYALVLTDCHMPNMDGFELTEAIREGEAGGTRLPVIAVTANAMQGEGQRCLARGMDDYLSKPLRMNELGPMLAKWMPPAVPIPGRDLGTADAARQTLPESPPARAEVAIPEEAGLAPATVWDPTTLSQLVGDNPAMHRRLLQKFQLNAGGQVAAIAAAAQAGQANRVADVAHTLKSAARSVGALALGDVCQALEIAGQAGAAVECDALAHHLAWTYSATVEKLAHHRWQK